MASTCSQNSASRHFRLLKSSFGSPAALANADLQEGFSFTEDTLIRTKPRRPLTQTPAPLDAQQFDWHQVRREYFSPSVEFQANFMNQRCHRYNFCVK